MLVPSWRFAQDNQILIVAGASFDVLQDVEPPAERFSGIRLRLIGITVNTGADDLLDPMRNGAVVNSCFQKRVDGGSKSEPTGGSTVHRSHENSAGPQNAVHLRQPLLLSGSSQMREDRECRDSIEVVVRIRRRRIKLHHGELAVLQVRAAPYDRV